MAFKKYPQIISNHSFLYYEDNLQSVWISNSSRTDCTSKFNPRANHLLFSQQSSELFLKLTSFKKSSEKTLGYQETKKREKSSQNFQTSPEIVGFKGHASPSRMTLHKFPLHKRPGRNTLPSERNLKQEFDTNRQRAELLEYGLWIDKSVWPQYHLTF